MYLTTYGKYHRSFKPTEHDEYARKDAATYWDLEGYPKAWGHGVEDNPVPRDAVPREPLPMRDEAQFKHPTKVCLPISSILPPQSSDPIHNYSVLYINAYVVHITRSLDCEQVLHVPRRLPFVPHTGLRTETQAAFQTPSSAQNKWNWICEEDTPYLLPRPSPTVPFSAPAMYRTEYENIGDEKPVTV